MKKLLLLLIALAASVAAWADGTLFLGENQLGQLGEDGSSYSFCYTFTPTEDGLYRFWSESDIELEAWQNLDIYVMQAGGLLFYDDQAGHFDCQGRLSCGGGGDDGLIDIGEGSGNGSYDIVIAILNYVGSITLHIEKVDESVLTLGDNTVAFVSGETVVRDFTPAESGNYRFYSTGGFDTKITIKEGDNEIASDDDNGEGSNFDCTATLTGGTTYTLELFSYNVTSDVTVTIEKVGDPTPEPTSLELGDNTVAFVSGETVVRDFTPAESGNYRFYSTGGFDTKITIKEGDNEIASDDDNGEGSNFDCTATLTGGTTYTLELFSYNVTSDVTVTIEKVGDPTPEPTSLELGDNTVAFVSGETVVRDFTPAESGNYRFYSTGGFDTKITIKEGDNEIASDDDNGEGSNFDCTATLTGGTTYTLELYSYDGNGNVTLTIEKIADTHLRLGTNTVAFEEGETTTLRFITGAETCDYRFYSNGSEVDTKITIRMPGNDALVATDDNSGDGNNFDCTAQLSYYSEFKVELYSNSGSGYVTVTVEKVATPDPITVYFQCTATDWTQPHIRYFNSSYESDVKTMSAVSGNVWKAEIPYYSVSFMLSKDDTWNTETRTGNLSTNEYATPLGAQKNGSTEEFGRYFVGANPFIYSVNIPATVGGSVSARLYLQEEPWSDGYAYNDYVQLTVTPNAGYQFENMTVTDENSNPINVVDNAFRMPASNVTITATFTAIPFTVTVPESFEHGTVECDKETADYGETVTLTVTPDEGYELNALTVTVVGDEPSGISTLRLRGGELVELTPGDEPNTYTFEMPAAPVTVNATFVETIITAVTDLTKTQPTGQRYNIMGQPVGKDYKGIVIEDGKKKVVK